LATAFCRPTCRMRRCRTSCNRPRRCRQIGRRDLMPALLNLARYYPPRRVRARKAVNAYG
jgi:hypothetical protein